MKRNAENKAVGNGSKSLEERLAALERLVDTDPKMRSRRLGFNPNLLSPEEFAEVHPDGFHGTIRIPDPDPLTPKEANVYAQHEGGIAEAEESMQVALSEYEEATAKWHEAVQESRRCAGEAGDYKFDAHGGVIVPPTSPLYAARGREAEALEARQERERGLEKAMAKHGKAIRARDLELHAVRVGNGRGVLAEIREKILG